MKQKYINRLISLHLSSWNKNIFIRTRNAHGINNIIKRCQYELKAGHKGILLIYCDAGLDEGYPSRESFKKILSYVNKSFSKEGDSLVYFASPVTLKIVLSHFGKVSVKYEDKARNKELVHSLSGVTRYGESGEKIDQLMGKINETNYLMMKENLRDAPTSYLAYNSTNFLNLITHLEEDNLKWFKNLLKRLF